MVKKLVASAADTTLRIWRIILLTLLISVVIGVVNASFLHALTVVTNYRELHTWLIYLLPLAAVCTVFVYAKFGKGSDRGNNLIIESVHEDKPVPARMAIFTYAFTLLTHFVGGSAGKEGTAVQIGGTVANTAARKLHLAPETKRALIMGGISAGFASVFGTPLTGAFFGLEMFFVGKLSYEAIIPCFLASYTSVAVVNLLGFHHESYAIASVPHMSIKVILVVIIASNLFGLVGRYFSVAIHKIKDFYAQRIPNIYVRALVAGAIVLAIVLIFQLWSYSGLSTWMISKGLTGATSFLDTIKKFFFTVFTLGAGMQGGEVTPLFCLGSSLGGAIGHVAGVSPSLLAALGMITVFGCATNTPITTLMLGIELFGIQAAPYYVIAVIITYYLAGHHSIYSAQKVETPKFNRSMDAKGKSLSNLDKDD